MATRMAFQDAMQGEFTELVQQATQRPVRAFISQVHIAAGLAVEIFLFGPETELSAPNEPRWRGDNRGQR